MNTYQNIGVYLSNKVAGPFVDHNYQKRLFLSKSSVRLINKVRANHIRVFLYILILYSRFFCLDKFVGLKHSSVNYNRYLSNVKLQTVFGLVTKNDSLIMTNQQVLNPSFNLEKIQSRVFPILEPLNEITLPNYTTASTCAPYNYYHFMTDYIIPFMSLNNHSTKVLYLPFYPNKWQLEILNELNIKYAHSKFQANVFFHNLEVLPPVFEGSFGEANVKHFKFMQEIIANARESLVSITGNNLLKIFCSRKNVSREPDGITEIEKFFLKRGFLIYNSDEIPFKEAKKLFMQAKLIIGVHGSGLTNVIFAPSTCKMIELAPVKFKNISKTDPCFYELCIACNVGYQKYEFKNGIDLLSILDKNFTNF